MPGSTIRPQHSAEHLYRCPMLSSEPLASGLAKAFSPTVPASRAQLCFMSPCACPFYSNQNMVSICLARGNLLVGINK
ncbi:unnamed protein product [Protopolystoma xenopodis]|uniref:Uncharacterized protein n=1 Tax=Protopolystoma xenopodis TaxID=117903 RepID=A0A448WNE2_9PLAT|nr:unnamed protein product [Protopolystoma xenopodis]